MVTPRWPFKVTRDGNVIERATGVRVGRVLLHREDGWVGHVRQDRFGGGASWADDRVWVLHDNSRRGAARAVWNEYVRRRQA